MLLNQKQPGATECIKQSNLHSTESCSMPYRPVAQVVVMPYWLASPHSYRLRSARLPLWYAAGQVIHQQAPATCRMDEGPPKVGKMQWAHWKGDVNFESRLRRSDERRRTLHCMVL